MLRSHDRELLLRREGGHPLNDRALTELVGKTIDCEGVLRDDLLIMSTWRVLE